MNDRRMFSRGIITSDKFTDMSPLAQLVYVRACLEADDEGFISSIKSLARSMGASSDDVAALKKSGLVIVFESGVAVITDWKIHNLNLRADRTTPSIFSEKSLVVEMPNKRYQLKEDDDKKVKDFEKSSKKVKKSEKCGAREEKRREDKIRECVVSRARAERGGSSSSDSFSKKATEGDEETETESNRGDIVKGASFVFDKDHTEPGLYETLMKIETETNKEFEKTKQTESDFLDRAVSGFIFGQKMLRDSTDYEPIRATLRELMRIYGSQNVDKAAHIALENGHPGEVGYIKGVLRKISPIS